MNMIFPKIEEFLEEKQRNFICSDDHLTVIDIQYYNEIQQIVLLDNTMMLQKEAFPKIHQWL